MIIDCFPAFDEFKLAKFRISYLSSIVNLTVIGEGNLTHAGSAREEIWTDFFYQEIQQNKVIVMPIDISNVDTPMGRDVSQREQLVEWVCKTFPDSFYIISDLDEIPSKAQIIEATSKVRSVHFLSPTYFRFANWLTVDSHKDWSRGVISHTSLEPGANAGRFNKNLEVVRLNPGCHLSYVGKDYEAIARKYTEFAHQEFNFPLAKSRDFLEYSDKHVIDHLGRFESPGFGLLNILSQDNFNEIQQLLFVCNPEFFYQKQIPARPQRIFASLVISTICLLQNSFLRKEVYDTFILKQTTRTNWIAYPTIVYALFRLTFRKVKGYRKRLIMGGFFMLFRN